MEQPSVPEDFLWEVRPQLKGAKPKKIEIDSSYNGDVPSPLSFFYQFRDVIFRAHGSVLPNVIFEVLISIGLSVAALFWVPDEEFGPIGHQLVGTLLAFLIVFRSNNALSLYNEGRGHIGEVIASARVTAIHMIEDVAIALENAGDLGAEGVDVFDAEEGVRLLKLFYYVRARPSSLLPPPSSLPLRPCPVPMPRIASFLYLLIYCPDAIGA